MKDKTIDALQRLSQAMFIPVQMLPIAGLLIALGNILTNETLMEILPFLDNPVSAGFGYMLSSSLLTIFTNLGLLFAVSISVGLAKKKRLEAGFTSFLAYLVFLYAMNAFMTITDLLAPAETMRQAGQTISLGVQVFDTGVFMGVVLGVGVAYLHNRFADIEFTGIFQIYGGSRFVFIVLIPFIILFAAMVSLTWSVIDGWIDSFSRFISQTGNFGLMTYGVLERLLIPSGLHHLLSTPFLYTSLGGVQEVGGVIFEGSRSIYLAEITDSSVAVLSESVIWDARGISKMFGLIGTSLAMYHTAKPENKPKVRALLIPAAITSAVAGVTEPIEFTFMFVSPALYVVHSFLSGLSMVMLNLLNVRTIAPSGYIDFLIYNIPVGIEKTRWPLYVLVGLIFFILYYIVFYLAITRFDIKTIGREVQAEDLRLYTKADVESKHREELKDRHGEMVGENKGNKRQLAIIIVKALGGAENIKTLTNCHSRLRLTVDDPTKVNTFVLKDITGASGVVIQDNNVQIVYGVEVAKIRRSMDEYLGWQEEKD